MSHDVPSRVGQLLNAVVLARFRAGFSCVSFLCVPSFTGFSLHAQVPSPDSSSKVQNVASPAPSRSSLPANLATITTDTGEFAPGPREFTRYSNPTMCLAAANNMEDWARRGVTDREHFDSLTNTFVRPSISPAVSAKVRACSARFFSNSRATAADLTILYAVALHASDSALASATLTRLLAKTKTSTDRNYIRLDAMGALLGVPNRMFDVAVDPPDTARARQLLGQIDTATGVSADMRMAARDILLKFLTRTDDTQHRDTVAIRTLAQEVITLWQTVPRAQRTGEVAGAMIRAYRALVTTALASGQAVTDVARDAMRDIAMMPSPPKIDVDSARKNVPIPSAPVAAVVEWLAPNQYVLAQRHIHTPPLHADYWFVAPHGDSLQPARGKISVWLKLPPWCSYDYAMWSDEGGCWNQEASVLRQWLAEYDPANVNFTVVTQTLGGSRWEGNISPAREAERARWFVQDYYHLPVTVAVQVSGFDTLPAPDRRRFVNKKYGGPLGDRWIEFNVPAVKNIQDLELGGRSGIVITGSNGTLLFATGLNEAPGYGFNVPLLSDILPLITRVLHAQ